MRNGWDGRRNGRNDGGGRDFRERRFVMDVPQGGQGNDERDFYQERTEVKTHALTCPHCGQAADHALSWLVRRKKPQLTGYADAGRQARFEKARSYMVRRDDQVACQNVRCRKRFEIAGLQSVAFLENEAAGTVEDRAARVRAAFAGRRG